MKLHFLTTLFSASLLIGAQAYAAPQAQDGANILKDKAISYAVQASKEANFDMKAASQQLSQDAFSLGKIYSSGYALKLSDVTSEQCLEEVAQLGVDSQTFINKALAGQYKTIAVVNGNFVMLIAAGAGELTYTVIDKGGYCTIEKSIHDAYWAANIIRLGIDGINVAFS